MRKKELKLIITFHTTTEAIAIEKMCVEKGFAGRLIPVPRSVTAGCGLAWSVDVEEKENMEQLLIEANIEYEEMQECMV